MPTVGNNYESQYIGNHPIPIATVPSAGMVKSNGNELQTAVPGVDYIDSEEVLSILSKKMTLNYFIGQI